MQVLAEPIWGMSVNISWPFVFTTPLVGVRLPMEDALMNTVRARLAICCAISLLTLATLAAPATAVEQAVAARADLLAGPSGAQTFVRPETPTIVGPASATFKVTYTGFSAAAKAAFQRAVNLWAQKVSSPVTITVAASFEPLGTGILGSAGSKSFWRDFAGAPRASTWYVDALANKLAGHQLDAAPDIIARFSSVFPNWYFGTGQAPANTYDFTSVVLHELGHGLGFLGAGRTSGSAGSVRFNGFPVIYDQYTENKAGKLLKTFTDPSSALGTQLRSGGVFFDSPKVRSANGGLRAKLYAPAIFQPGSSYSHLDEATYLRGNPNSLMTPQLGQGETIRNPGPITLALFKTLGW